MVIYIYRWILAIYVTEGLTRLFIICPSPRKGAGSPQSTLYIYMAKYSKQLIGNDLSLHRSGEKKIKIKGTEIKPIPYKSNDAENPNELFQWWRGDGKEESSECVGRESNQGR